MMDFVAVVDQVIALLRQRGRVTYRTLQRQFQLDTDALADLLAELRYAYRDEILEEEQGVLWVGDARSPLPASTAPATPTVLAPLGYTPAYLAEQILTSRRALEGERKQVTVLFADLKGSMELLAERDPEEARQLLDPALHVMMEAVHRYEGTVNQVLGDGIRALFGAPVAHEDHAARACYAARVMQEALQRYAEEVRRTQGLLVQMRVGLNSGEVVVRAIGNDLRMDYSAVGQTTHLAARMEQLATPGSILLTTATLRLVEGLVRVQALGPVPVKGLAELVEGFELVGVTALRRRLQAAAARGLSPFVGRQSELAVLQQALTRAGAGQGQVAALLGEPGVGKSRLVYEFLQSHHTQGWLRLESSSVSYDKATAYLPVCDLLKAYCHLEDCDDLRTVRAKVTGHILTLDEALQDTVPAVLALFAALLADNAFLALDPLQRRRRTLEALKRVLLCASQVQPLLLVFEDLHWIDTETQAVLDLLGESLPTARVLLLVNYRPEYQHGWGSKTSYTPLRLDPLTETSAEELLQALLGEDASLVPLTQLLIARTQGNPFFLEESVRTLVETGVLVGDWGTYHLAPRSTPCRYQPQCKRCWLRASIGCHRRTNVCSRPRRSLARRCPGPCCRPSLTRPTRRCTTAWRISRRQSSSMRPGCFPSTPPPSSTPSRTRWHTGVCSRSGGAHCTRALSRRWRLWRGTGGTTRWNGWRSTPYGVLDHLRRAEIHAETLGDHLRLGQVYAEMGGTFSVAGDVDRAIAYGQRALALAATLGHVGLQARAHLSLGQVYYDTGDYPRAVESFGWNVATFQGELLSERFGTNGSVAANSRAGLSLCHAERGAFTEGLAMAEDGLRIAETVNHPFSLIEAYYGVSGVYRRQGDAQRAIPMLERALGLCQDWDIVLLSPWIAAALGLVYAMEGRIAVGLALAEQAAEQTVARGIV
jgi:class 3 adenylate cyclase